MAIDKLTRVSSLDATDLIALFSRGSGGDASTTLTTLAAFIQTLLAVPGVMATQYAAPSATGFNVTIAPLTSGGDVFLPMRPAAAYAAGTITLPELSTCIDGQEVLVTSTQAVTTLTVAGNGSTVLGAPTALTTNSFFKLRFDGVFSAWHRVG